MALQIRCNSPILQIEETKNQSSGVICSFLRPDMIHHTATFNMKDHKCVR